MATQKSESPVAEVLECPVCYQECVHPVKLPCDHVFCYLCVKGVVTRTRRCAMCRRDVSMSYLDNPVMVNKSDLEFNNQAHAEDVKWFYQARRRGWWLYEERIATELEQRFQENPQEVFDIQIAGFLYTIDLENMEQYRKDDRNVSRAIKRDHIKHVKEVQGKAGLRRNNLLSDSAISRTVEGSPTTESSNTAPNDTSAPSTAQTAHSTSSPGSARSASRVFRQSPAVDISQLVSDMNLIDRDSNSSDESETPESLV